MKEEELWALIAEKHTETDGGFDGTKGLITPGLSYLYKQVDNPGHRKKLGLAPGESCTYMKALQDIYVKEAMEGDTRKASFLLSIEKFESSERWRMIELNEKRRQFNAKMQAERAKANGKQIDGELSVRDALALIGDRI
jgi:hypothetical protein